MILVYDLGECSKTAINKEFNPCMGVVSNTLNLAMCNLALRGLSYFSSFQSKKQELLERRGEMQ
jgi:hypothetical protein